VAELRLGAVEVAFDSSTLASPDPLVLPATMGFLGMVSQAYPVSSGRGYRRQAFTVKQQEIAVVVQFVPTRQGSGARSCDLWRQE
jgi:hypothetical protein